ncbi:pyruvate kinase [Roseimicrobium gellanilyticum]|uniref:Pyruvate kinase n=1 Tax=Roseimicrobium gellanilyticum TaxID=748857 RepID=A0A366H8D1_9BACT|nr:pyruvate kinase [Roseimicrobium gellanilyticum]RBP38039.1 pyruvate kinase [Roseimicrobium gellanilyticum]
MNATAAGDATVAPLPSHKTKIVATIGPASESPEMLVRLIKAGLNVARLNFSHGDFEHHGEVIRRLRDASKVAGRRVAIMADLPGPKMRLGKIQPEPIQLSPGDRFTLTSEDIVGSETRVSMTFEPLPRVVQPGNRIFLNDGIVQLVVERVVGNDVECVVAVGGELRSKKGLNLPGIDLGIGAFTERDQKCLEFALAAGVDAVSQSFVERASDIEALRAAASKLGRQPFIIAKIERSDALVHFDEILSVADGIMVARGDLGVEVPIESIAQTQKMLIAKANLAGKPVITATQMLESMTSSRLPTRAEATDVANAILDGTDCVMLSGESAMGKFPEEAVQMLARIAAATEPARPRGKRVDPLGLIQPKANESTSERIASLVEHALNTVPCDIALVPTRGGSTARIFSRCKPQVWSIAPSVDPAVCQGLSFSYGVHAVDLEEEPADWKEYVRQWLGGHGINATRVIMVAGPSPRNPHANHRIEFMRLDTP